jgi:RES domain-containing protein
VPAQIDHVPVTGTWFRHVAAGRDPLTVSVRSQGRWQRGATIQAVYVADSAATAWAEFYRAAAELAIAPDALLPRDLWSLSVELPHVADLTETAALRTLGLAPAIPDRGQWPAYQDVGERLAAAGAEGVLYRSAARPAHACLCVFAHALDRVRPLEHERIDRPPAPPYQRRSESSSARQCRK